MFIESIFEILNQINEFFWSYIGFAIVMVSGLYFTLKNKGYQFRVLLKPGKTFKALKESSKDSSSGVHPFKLFFASVGGMVGLANMVAVIAALIIGGPGALFWLWLAAFFGMIIKYAEIYLGVKYRVKNQNNSFDGGPMYYLQRAFKSPFLKVAMPSIVSLLLCIYGVEIYQFVIIVDTFTGTFDLNRHIVMVVLLGATLYAGFGGIHRLANICSVLMPFFMIVYVLMCLWVIGHNLSALPALLLEVFTSAFQGSAALGGFAGSSILLAAQAGVSRAVYSGDIGIGYDSIIQSETRTTRPEQQARLAIFGTLGDVIFSTMSILLVLSTGLLWSAEGLKASEYVSTALGGYFPYIQYFMAIFFFLAGWTTIIGFLAVGTKAARFLSPRYGFRVYIAYATLALALFSYVDQTKVYLIMALSGGLLMSLNILGLFKLRKEIKFL